MTVRIGCAQLTWRGMSEAEILPQIAELGYQGSPPFLRGGATVAEIQHRFADNALACAPPYFGGRFFDAAAEGEILAKADELGALAKSVGCTEVYVACGGGGPQTPAGDERGAIAGRVQPSDAMSDDLFAQTAATLSRFGEITLRHGVRSCFHNHVGTVVETAYELDKLIALCDDTVFLGLDVGHLAWAGDDPVAVVARYGERVLTLHLKDIDDQVRRRGVGERWSYDEFTRNGVFIELGGGCVDFPALKQYLDSRSFDGWLIVETDVTQLPTAAASARVSRDYLRGVGWWPTV